MQFSVGVLAITERTRDIPAGLVGEIRRTVAGGRFDVDHRHAELEFDLVVRGSGSFTLDNENYVLKPGTLIWLVPGQRHRLVRGPHLEMWVVSVRPDLVDVGRIEDLGARPSRLLPGHELVDLDRLLSQVAQDSDEPSVYNAGIIYLTMRAWRASRDTPSATRRPMHSAVARALLLLRQSGGAMSLSQLAKEAGVTSPYLSRLLIEHSARSFVEWRNRIRLERFIAQYRPGDNLLSTAFNAGFGSYARFHRVFNDIVGCSPSEWIKRGADPAAAPHDLMEAPADYGMPETAALSARQRWTRLVPALGAATGTLFGQGFLKQLVAAAPQEGGGASRQFDRLDGSLPASERERLLAALRSKDPVVADDLARVLEAVDFADTYKGIVEFFGYSASSLVDAATAFVLVVCVAANRASDPVPDQTGAARKQVLGALTGTLARLGEEAAQSAHTTLIAAFVVTYHALQATRASGDPRAFHEFGEAARRSAREALGGDVTKIVLTSSGFVPRQRASKGARSGVKPPPSRSSA